MKTYKFQFHILMGLPGSGKSYFAKNYLKRNGEGEKFTIKMIDLDEYISQNNDIETCLRESFYKEHVAQKGKHDYYLTSQKIIIDGLILTRENLKKVMDICIKTVSENCSNYSYEIEFDIHVWNDDRNTCINNDKFRLDNLERVYSSELTIKNSKFDQIDENVVVSILNELNTHTKYMVIGHDVYKMSNYDVLIKPFENHFQNPDVLVSNSWSKGGSWADCWGNSGTISPDTTPEFKEFDDLLTEVCPNITFLQYKKLYNECVEEEEYSDRDYYGGTEYRGVWTCDLRKLYEMLLDMNIIKD